MTKRADRIPLTSPAEIPTHFRSEDEEAAFWSTHELTPELWAQLPPLPAWAERFKWQLRASRHRTGV